jgi:hypothetical protein
VIAAALLIGIAFVGGLGVVAGLRWPHDRDYFRNIASAIAFRDGHLLSDPHFAGVPASYSPLTSALLAFVSLVTSVPISRLGTQGGAYLNLLTPSALVWVTARWFGRRAALATLVAFLFAMGIGYPSWTVVSYLPYLFVPFYALGLFLLALACLPAAVNRRSDRDGLLLGLTTGLLALAHPGAIMILVGIVAVHFARAALRASRASRRRLTRTACIALSTAALVSAPFWLPIAVHSQGRVANKGATIYIWEPLRSGNIWRFFMEFSWRWPMAVIAVGLPLWIAWQRRQPRTDQPIQPQRRTAGDHVGGTGDAVSIVTTWTVLMLVGLVLASYRPRWFPLPSYHFLFYLSAVLCIWFGISLDAIARTVFGRWHRRWGALAVLVSVAGIALWSVPPWRSEEQGARTRSLFLQAYFEDFAAVDWMRENTKSSDVFLNAPTAVPEWDVIAFLPALAGRHSVNIDSAEFTNPFVDFNEREVDASLMLQALQSCDFERFEQRATEYGRVRYVLIPAPSFLRGGIEKPPSVLASLGLSPRTLVGPSCRDAVPSVYRDKRVIIHRIDPRWPLDPAA